MVNDPMASDNCKPSLDCQTFPSRATLTTTNCSNYLVDPKGLSRSMMRKTNLPNRSILSLTIITIALIKILPAALAETPNQQATAAKPARPNILLIMTDDHANRALGAYGGPLKDLNPTPNLDKIAQQGIRFDNAFVTNSICGPSRAVILTGKYSHLNGFYTNERGTFNASQQTFPKLMQKAGYQTAMIGKCIW